MTRTVSVRIEGGGGQTVDFIEHLTLDDRGVRRGKLHTLRVLIHDDSYAEQAWGRVERWDGTKWHAVASIRGDAMKIEHGIGYQFTAHAAVSDRDKARFFSADRNALVKLAEEVL